MNLEPIELHHGTLRGHLTHLVTRRFLTKHVRDQNVPHTPALGFRNQEKHLFRGRMPHRQHEVVLSDQRQDLDQRRNRCAALNDPNERLPATGSSDVELGIKRREPDDLAPSAFKRDHLPNRLGVDAAHR